MTFQRTNVSKTHFFKKPPGNKKYFPRFFYLLKQSDQILTHTGNFSQQFFCIGSQLSYRMTGHQAV